MITKKAGQLYLKLEKCDEVPLVLFTLGEFGSLDEMDTVLAKGRFMSYLAIRLA